MGKEIHFKRNNSVYTRMLVLSIFGTVIMTIYYLQELSTASFLWMFILSLFGFMFLAMLGTSVVKLLKNAPALSLTDSGLVDRISLANMGSIPWRSISFVKYDDYLNQKQILIGVKESEKFINKLPFLKRKMVNQQFVDTGAVIVVSPKMIKGKPEDVVSQIKRRARV